MFLFVIFLLLFSPPVFAETVELDRLVITPSRISEDNTNLSSNVTLISRQKIEAEHATTLGDLLKGQEGIQLTDNSTPKTVIADIRGFGDAASRSVLVLVNNRRVNPVDNSSPDFLQIPVNSIERIEVIRGAGSVLYGDNAVGGVINIITKKGREGFHGSLASSYGSYDTLKTSQEFYGGKGAVDYYFNAQQLRTDGYRINSQLRSRDYVSRIGIVPDERVSFDINANWHEDKYGLPGGIKDVPLATLGRRATSNPEDFAMTKDRMVQLTTDLNPWPEEELGHFVIDTSFRNRDTYAVFYSFGEYATKRDINSWGITAKHVLDRDIIGHRVKLATGIDYYMDDNWIYGSAGNSDNLTITKNEFGLYSNGSVEVLEHLFVEAGTRYEKADYTFNQVSGTQTYQKQHPDKWIGLSGLRYEYAKDSNVFVNAQQTFRFLTTDDWFDTFNGLNTSLNQQKGIQYQAGIRHRFNDKIKVSVTPYWIDTHNEIFQDPLGGGGFGAIGNYKRTRRVGVEAGSDINLKNVLALDGLDAFDWHLNYTYQDAVFNGGVYDGNTVPMAARHMAATGFMVGFLRHYNYSFDARYVGKQYAINDVGNVLSQNAGYVVCDTRLSFHMGDWEIFGQIDNLFGAKYDVYVAKSISSNTKSHMPAPERSFMTGIKYSF